MRLIGDGFLANMFPIFTITSHHEPLQALFTNIHHYQATIHTKKPLLAPSFTTKKHPQSVAVRRKGTPVAQPPASQGTTAGLEVPLSGGG